MAGSTSARSKDVVAMLFGAAIFGYFGFFVGWGHERALDGHLLWAVVLLKWSLRIGAVLFALAALLAFARRSEAAIVDAIAAIGTAVAFVVVAIWDMTHPQYSAGVHPLILLLFAAWNGWGGWEWIRERQLALAGAGSGGVRS